MRSRGGGPVVVGGRSPGSAARGRRTRRYCVEGVEARRVQRVCVVRVLGVDGERVGRAQTGGLKQSREGAIMN